VTDGTFGWHLGVLVRAHASLLMAALGDFPHGPRGYQTLATVVDGGHPNQVALAGYLGIDRTVMTYLIDDLARAGLVERQQSPTDRRHRKIVATPAGVTTYQEREARVRDAEDHLLRALDPAERDTFRTLLRRVACDLRDIEPGADVCDAVARAVADVPRSSDRKGSAG
jgi:DNA-binding MarR family transcriptional regulator